MKVRVGIEGITMDSAHYTLSSYADSQIHGHTYIINVEVEGEVNEKSGFVVDFNLLKKMIREVIQEWDHKLIIPKVDLDKSRFEGPFRVDYKVIDAPFPTAEYIGIEIAKDIYLKLNKKYRILLKIYEGKDSYAIIEYP
ncbi:MAG: 6-pyruvoyl tetrahydropterin synthase family protein [Saccharolobus sp.]|uniref:6-carboxy-5,6,7,8-tetrahydropterin synthase n=2 Tax=Saccharolobus shibatae TaxID=2286 RepID=A0A8F5GVZ5_9CREN|nr:6-pyruvoyl tetrahydropterin synthase family protein [Saccharolobus shibatae]MCH4815304.1 6-pyruvoyl tetrahydropterin synthase family protein [Saccharolobus shibatae]QXJ28317.1 6-carboxy-5,6,7,8-tetrahydropterin synthase [Saccharolobus shibatae B12]QXJ31648.1 6-carboxy-5,6,7,8-tetrahydropterin synthase [Saccharolobus shibatae]QXJ34668.1 6-carboxy-5,6,7,8-tetrahydropterin synthase [Saccharolobus shibatae]